MLVQNADAPKIAIAPLHHQHTFNGEGTRDTPTESVYENIIPSSIGWQIISMKPMPLAIFLEYGFTSNMPFGWHRLCEQMAAKQPVTDPEIDLDAWETDLVWAEIMLLTGLPEQNFIHLARAWGRQPGFHIQFARDMCRHRIICRQQQHGVEALTNLHGPMNQSWDGVRDETKTSLHASFVAFVADPNPLEITQDMVKNEN